MPIHSLLEIDFLNAKRKPASPSGRRKRALARDDPGSLSNSRYMRELRQLPAEAAPPPFVQNRNCSPDLQKIRGCALDQTQRKKTQMLDSRAYQEPLEIGQSRRGLWKACSEPMMPSTRTMSASMDLKRALEQNLEGVWEFDESQSTVRRCMTETDIQHPADTSPARAPDLLQLFNIFYFNAPERPPSKVLVNVTLEGSIHAVRLLVGHDACVQDVIRASLKAYAKEGLVPRKGSWDQAYGLHYSQFCLESINPAEAINRLGTRKFFLYPSSTSQKLLNSEASQSSKAKPWWHIFSLT